jgi:hypothetical protein
MQIQLKHARKFSVDGKGKPAKFFPPGTHTVPDELADDWFFKGQVKEGHVSILAAPDKAEKPTQPQAKGKA